MSHRLATTGYEFIRIPPRPVEKSGGPALHRIYAESACFYRGFANSRIAVTPKVTPLVRPFQGSSSELLLHRNVVRESLFSASPTLTPTGGCEPSPPQIVKSPGQRTIARVPHESGRSRQFAHRGSLRLERARQVQSLQGYRGSRLLRR